MAAKSRTAKYYASHPEARKKKAKYDKKFNARPSNVNKREELNRYNRQKGTYGNGDGLDASHKGNRITGFTKASTNRGSRSNTPGDRRARGRFRFKK